MKFWGNEIHFLDVANIIRVTRSDDEWVGYNIVKGFIPYLKKKVNFKQYGWEGTFVDKKGNRKVLDYTVVQVTYKFFIPVKYDIVGPLMDYYRFIPIKEQQYLMDIDYFKKSKFK